MEADTLFKIESIVDQSIITGPAIVTGRNTTIVLKAGWEIYKNVTGDFILKRTVTKKILRQG